MRSWYIVLCVTTLAVTSARADVTSANAHLRGCQILATPNPSIESVTEVQETALCMGKLIALDKLNPLLQKRYRFCAAPTVNYLQGAMVIIKFLEEHPERLHEEFTLLALEALRSAFPCD
jgi:hypothetical protein